MSTSAADLHQRLLAVVASSGSLLQSPEVDNVIPAVLRIARDIIAADGYAVWRLEKHGVWQIRSFDGVSARFANHPVSAVRDSGIARDTFTRPTPIDDVLADPTLSYRTAAYEAEGIRSMLAIPLVVGAVQTASLVFYYRVPHTFTDVEVETAAALGHMAAVALTTAELYDEQRRTREHAAFLAQASAALSDSLDFETTLQTVARLAVPGVADSCAIHLMDQSGAIRLVAAVHVDPLKADAMRTLADPATSSASRIWLRTIREGSTTLIADVNPADIHQALQDNEDLLRAFEAVGFTSQISVPLVARGRTIGGITFTLGAGTRRYDDADVRLAQDLAHRAAIAVDNAWLYQHANDANRLKDEFLGTLSHELRTPLNAILGYARMLRGGVFTDAAKQARAMEILERNAHALTQIVEDVLDVSRIVSGKLRLNIHPMDLAAVIEDSIGTIMPAADARGVRIETEIDRAVPRVAGDPERMQQVVWNLLSNAVKFTPRGGSIRIQLFVVDGTQAQLVVSDTGRGIPSEFLPHLFERFRQADSRFSREHGGLGLGLAIASEIVATHGGSLRAASAGEGLGSTFTISLPLVTAAAVQPRAVSVAATSDAGASHSIHGQLDGIRVLIVDDDDDARALVQAIVEEAGGTATTADSGAQALRRLDEIVPDVLIVDLGMPGMDGLALIEAVRQRLDVARDVPAIALTAYARSEDRVAALSGGFHSHLAKPVDHRLLAAAVRNVALERRPAPSA
jgi:signal transduction histidine kinase/ActR/RegA family two-component response regulator